MRFGKERELPDLQRKPPDAMSIDVHANILRGKMEHMDCILCGQGVDNCEQKVIAYSFGKKD